MENNSNNEINTKAAAPSNIAIVKYWGKKGVQKPINPSISFTLSKAQTYTQVNYQASHTPLQINFSFEGKNKDDFLPKLYTLVDRVKDLLPFLHSGTLNIASENTFPHSCGIASSASSMASIAHALLDVQKQLSPDAVKMNEQVLLSKMARLGSGSACRSTSHGWALWGKTPAHSQSSNSYSIPLTPSIHPLFNTLNDTILIIRKGAKAISSSMGHQLMNNHPYRHGRINQANTNIVKLLSALKSGDFNKFAQVCEEEAMSLHGLMMSSTPSYSLLTPETIHAIELIKQYKAHYQAPLTFTLDAGPNIHLIYPQSHSHVIKPFIKKHLQPLCENQEILYDKISGN